MNILELFHYGRKHGDKTETRICGILMRNGITTVEALRETSDKELMKLRGFGASSLQLIHSKLEELEE